MSTIARTEWKIRPLRPEDYDRWVEIYKEYDPEGPSADHQRKRLAEWPIDDPRLDIVAELADGRSAGFGRIMRRSHQAAGAFYLSIDVDPDFENLGIGSTILRELETFALPRGATILTAFVREGNDRARDFMAKRGYPLERNLFASQLDFLSFDMAPFESMRAEHRSDLSILSWSELGDSPENRNRLYELAKASDTAPDMEIWGFPAQDQFERDLFGSPWYCAECTLIALCDGEWAGLHTSGPVEQGSQQWTTDYTGVSPNYRGRGIGMALKLRSIEIAIAAGGTHTITHNDSENRWMLAINERLGFVRQPGWLQMRKRLPLPATAFSGGGN